MFGESFSRFLNQDAEMLETIFMALLLVIPGGTIEVPEKEFCDWFFNHCPYIKTPYRPIERAFTTVEIDLTFNARRLRKLDDVEQKLILFFSFLFVFYEIQYYSN